MASEQLELLARIHLQEMQRVHDIQMEELERSLKSLGFFLMVGLLLIAGLQLYSIS